VDLLFEMHVPALWDGWGNPEATELYVDRLRKQPVPIMMQQAYPDIPTAQVMPKDDVLKVVTPYHLGADAPYHTSQVSWMAAYAMYLLYDPLKIVEFYWRKAQGEDPEPLGEILFYGIDLISEGEARSYQRHCLEYYIGMCRGMGIRLTCAEESTLVKHTVNGQHKMYGYDYPLSRAEAVHVYGHPMRQLVKTKDGTVVDVRETPGLLGMPMIDVEGKNKMIVVGNTPESYRMIAQRNEDAARRDDPASESLDTQKESHAKA